jgi:membrane protein YqaA with SNARE-associated domain
MEITGGIRTFIIKYLLNRIQLSVYNGHIMVKQATEEEAAAIAGDGYAVEDTGKKSAKWSYILGILGIVLTVLMAAAIVIFKDQVQDLRQYGYMGAFFISILGGATIIVPVPMLAVVFALGGVMPSPWLVGIAAALGETIGGLTIYMTGHGAGRAISGSKHGRIQKAYERMLDLIERRGTITLFAVTSVVNPFFYPAAFACGALRFGIRKYIFIVLTGKIIKCMTIVYAGYFGLKGLFHAIGIDL